MDGGQSTVVFFYTLRTMIIWDYSNRILMHGLYNIHGFAVYCVCVHERERNLSPCPVTVALGRRDVEYET